MHTQAHDLCMCMCVCVCVCVWYMEVHVQCTCNTVLHVRDRTDHELCVSVYM